MVPDFLSLQCIRPPVMGLLALCGLLLTPPGLLAQGLDPSRAITQYIHHTWNTDDGLPQNSINAIVQTRDGYLWFGTYEGLARFDGIRFTVFNTQNTEAFVDNIIHTLYETQDGSLWIGTHGAGLLRYKGGTFTTFTTDDGLAHNHVSALAEDLDGRLWIGTHGGGLVRFENDTFTTYTTDDGLPNNAVNALYADGLGRLWIGTHGGGLVRLENDTFATYTTDDGLSNNFVWSLFEDRTGTLWIGTRGGGLNRLQQGSFSTYTTRDGLSHDHVNAIYEDRHGTLWVGTYGGGLNRFRDGQFTTFTTDHGLSDDVVRSILEDREGSLWVGTLGGGLNRFKNSKVTVFGEPEGLSDNAIRAVYEDRRGVLWIGTVSGGLNRLKDGTITTYTTDDGLSSNVVFSLYEARDGALWAGTRDGLNRLKDGTITTYTTDDGLPNGFIRTMTGGPDGSLWIGTNGGGLVQFKDSVFTTYTTDDGLSSNVVRILHIDHTGALWIGTRGGGLVRYKNNVFTTYETIDGLAHSSVTALHEDRAGVLWIGTYGGGLNRLVLSEREESDRVFTTYTTRDGLFDDVIHQILEDRQGHLWMSSNKGIARVAKHQLEDFATGRIKRITATPYGKADGMRNVECNGASPAGWRSRDGRLWFPTVQGVVAIDPRNETANTLVPPVHIETMVVDDADVNLHDADLMLPPGADRVAFVYAGLSYLAPENVRFRYRLDGYDKDWVEAGTRRAAYYTKLPPGAYTFRVVASNNDGLWNETGAAHSFYLKPFFYQTPWFILLTALGLLGAAWAGYRLRIRQLTRHTQALEQAVEERMRALRAQAEEIRRQKEGAEQAREVAEQAREAAEQAHEIKTQLLNIAAHDMKNPLSGIQGFAVMIKNGVVESERTSEVAEMIVEASNRMLHLVTELLDAAALESGDLKLNMRRVDLHALAGEVVHYNRNLAAQKGQQLVFSEPPNSTCFVEADAGRMREVMDNLVSNAIKYSPAGKTIWVRLRAGLTGVQFAVQDEGPGLSEADQQHLFKPFQRLSPQPTGGESSTGLGLSIVKKLVDLHGGSIHVRSALGQGTMFTITLPPVSRRNPALPTFKRRSSA